MWTVLEDTPDENDTAQKFVAYNYLHYGEENNKFSLVKMRFPKAGDDSKAAHFTYDRLDALEDGSAARDFHIVYTDYATHMVGEACHELNGGAEHRLDLSVWTRDKQPAMFTRQKLRSYLLERGHPIDSMVKSTLVDCWGEDKQ